VDFGAARILEWQILRCYNERMTDALRSIAALTDQQILEEVNELAQRERLSTTRLIAALAELDARRLYLGEGCSSLFVYCTQRLHLSEYAAYGRIEAARASRRFPVILTWLADGALTLTTVCLLKVHLTDDNHLALLNAARHKSKREVERQIAALRPSPPVPSSVRKLPSSPVVPAFPRIRETAVSKPTAQASATPATPVIDLYPAGSTRLTDPSRPAIVKPLAPARYRVQFTVTEEAHDKLRRVQDLLRHVVPNGDPAIIFDRALTLLLAQLERTKLGATERPRSVASSKPRSRHVPASVRREVWQRDAGRCAFVGSTGRCSERGFLEFHHVEPFADGGPTTTSNLELRCRAHNLYESRDLFEESG